MKSIFLSIPLLFSFLFTNYSFDQKVITHDDFALAGDSIGISTSNDFSIDYDTTGAGITWNFSSLTENSQIFEIAYSISSAGYIIQFQFGALAPPKYQASYYQPYNGLPLDQLGGFLPVNIESINKLTKVNNNQVDIVGYSLKVDGQQVGFRSDTIETYYTLPLHYGDSSYSRGYTNFDFNPIYDAQLIQYRQHESVVDGYGTLITPYGSYDDVLRVHHTITEKDSLHLIFGGFDQWIPINRNINEYEWWDNAKKRPVLKIETQGVANNEVPSQITFLNNQVAGIDENKIETTIYPNPTSHLITVQSNENLKTIKIWSIDGKCVFEAPCSGKEVMLNVETLSSGMYTLQLISEKSQGFKSIVIK